MWQHMSSFSYQLQAKNYSVRFIISSGFRWIEEVNDSIPFYVSTSTNSASIILDVISYFFSGRSRYLEIFRQNPPSALLLVSWHPLNFLVARLVKSLYPDVPILAWLHEPYKDQKRIYGSKAIIIWLIEWFQSLSLRYIDFIILHSSRGLRLFEQRYPKFSGGKYLIPLQFKDEELLSLNGKRRYLSFLGRADRAKGIDLFFSFVEELAEIAGDWQFQIVTSSNILGHLEKLSPLARQKLWVINKPQLTDRDLRQAAASSLSVLALYKETMQSGVIPVAWMQGAPVIGTDIEGITEWIRDRETGVIVSRSPTAPEIEAAITYIRTHFDEMSARCRSAYLSNFDDRNWERYYGWIEKLI